MCEFCENLEYRTYKLQRRRTSDNDNVCAVINTKVAYMDGEPVLMPFTCMSCNGCYDGHEHFEINTFDGQFSIGYYHKINELTVYRWSEIVDIKFCPFCGRKLVDDDDYGRDGA